LKGPSVSLSVGKALNLWQRSDFYFGYLLQLVGSDGKLARRWVNNECLGDHSSPCAHTDLLEHDVQCDHPRSMPSAPMPNHPDEGFLPPKISRSFQLQSGNRKLLVLRRVTCFSHLFPLCSWLVFYLAHAEDTEHSLTSVSVFNS